MRLVARRYDVYVMALSNRDGSTESVPSTPEGMPHVSSHSSSGTQINVSTVK